MIAVFKTNVTRKKDARQIVRELRWCYPLSYINFDLHDRDKILRIDAAEYSSQKLISIVNEHGFSCKELA